MTFHKCFCTYVPPHVLNSAAKRAEPQTRHRARNSVQQAKISRSRRGLRTLEMDSFLASTGSAATAASNNANREVWDSQHTWQQRVKLERAEGRPATGDSDVTEAYKFAGIVRDYIEKELNRNSIDNLGMKLVMNVHFGNDYMNAFWDGDEMTFGDGDGVIFTSFAQSLDVMAHELAHGITQLTANLDYYSQSGALNEHFSDVIGTAITQSHLRQEEDDADWLIGNEIMGPMLFGEALRSMKAPGSAYDNSLLGKDPQPSHMSNYYTGLADNQGVHINSGIPNRAFYLTATDIGTREATKVWYHALQNLWSAADFNDAVDVIVESARILTKANVVPQGAPQAVRLAFKEVGLPT